MNDGPHEKGERKISNSEDYRGTRKGTINIEYDYDFKYKEYINDIQYGDYGEFKILVVEVPPQEKTTENQNEQK